MPCRSGACAFRVVVVTLLLVMIGLTGTPLATAAQPSPAGSASDVSVAGLTVSYGPAWVYDDANSVPETRVYLDAADAALVRFYGLFVADNPGIDAPSARDDFASAYLDRIGVANAQPIANAAPSPGTAWSAVRGEASGQPLVAVVYADVASTIGQVQIHLLVTTPDDLQPALAEARASIQVDGAAAFRDLDPAVVPIGAPAAAATADPAAMLPETYLGIWTGTGTESDLTTTWPVSVVFRGGGVDEVVGTTTYPSLACSGVLVLQQIDDQRITIIERITTGIPNCVDGGAMTFRDPGTGSQLAFTWMLPDGSAGAAGVLATVVASSQVVGASTVRFSDAWEADPANADPASLRLSHAVIPDTLYLYSEIPDPAATSTDSVLAGVEDGFFDGFGDGDQAVVATGTLPSGAGWRLYTVGRQGVPFAVLIAVDVTTQPGQVLLSVLLAPTQTLGFATQVVQDSIGIDDRGSPLAGLDAAEIDATLVAP